jgi:hypothetical protein
MMMEAVSTSETPVNLYETVGHNISEDSHLHTHNHENLKPHSENQVEKMGDKWNWLRIAFSGSLRY